MEEGGDEILCGGGGKLERRGGRHLDLRRKPGEGVGDAFGRSGVGPDRVATIVLEGGADVPAFDGVGCPGFVHGRWLVDEDTSTGRSKRRAIEVKRAVDLRPCGEVRVDARRAK